MPAVEPVSVTWRKESRLALASTGWVNVTARDKASLYWRGWQLRAAKGSALPTTALAGNAGVAPAAPCGVPLGAVCAVGAGAGFTG
ncbi:hypothetical protein D3C86_1826780 [compost metagenome]